MSRVFSSALIVLATILYAPGCGEDGPETDTDTDTDSDTDGDGTEVTVETTEGTMVILLDPENAPVTVANFQTYVDDGFYDGTDGKDATIFHRITKSGIFVIQGGGETEAGSQKSTHDPIVLESDNGLSNTRGTIAMARTNVPDSATSQFYINYEDNTGLDYTSSSNPGYAVFGEVIEGLDVMADIGAAPTDGSDRPVTDIVITSMTRK